MAELIEFTYAQLSLAAYAEFNKYAPLEALVKAGFSLAQAEQFVATYRILDHQPNTTGSGFSATVFQRIGDENSRILAIRGTEPTPTDLISDISIGLFGTVVLQPQYAALTDYLRDLRNLGIISATQNFSVTGHSLGGYLKEKRGQLLFRRGAGSSSWAERGLQAQGAAIFVCQVPARTIVNG